MPTLYEILGVEPSADEATIRIAYLRLAKVLHPDRKGGDEEAFKEIQGAWDVLDDPDRRAHYDKTGATEALDAEAHRQHTRVMVFLRELMEVIVLNSPKGPRDDLAKFGLEVIDEKLKEVDAFIAKQRVSVKKLRHVIKRWKRKTAGAPNYVQRILEQQLEGFQKKITAVRGDRKVVEDARALMLDYDFTVAPPKQPAAAPEPSIVVIDQGGLDAFMREVMLKELRHRHR